MKNFILTILIIVIWSSSTIAMTGDVEKQIPAPGSCLTGLTFDGKHIWGVDRKSDKIYKIDPADGKIINSFTSPGYFPTGLAWDGEHLWVSDLDFTNTSTESYSGKIYQVCPKSGKTLSVIMSPGANPMGLAWDGKYLWVSDNKDDMIYQISPDDGTTISSFKAPASNPGGMTWDGNYLWIADRAQDEIYRVHPTKGIVVMIIDAPGPYAWGLAWNGEKLLNTDYQTDKISEIKIFDKEPYKRTNERFEDIEFTNDIINFGPGSLTNIDLYFAEPGNRSNQEIVEITYPVEPKDFLTDKWGQKVAHFNYENIKAGSRISPAIKVKAKIYEVRYNVFPEKVGSLKDISKKIKNTFLADGQKYNIKNPVIQNGVKEAVGEEKNPYWIARNIFDYLREKLHYERIGGWDIAPTVLARGSGSCSEYTFVYIAMCRAAGVPARYVGSVVARGEDASYDFVYHRWVEVYLPNYGWVPVDPSGGDRKWPHEQTDYFGHLNNRFLITTEGGGDSEYLGWDYNSFEKWQADGPVQLREEKIAEWSPAK